MRYLKQWCQRNII